MGILVDGRLYMLWTKRCDECQRPLEVVIVILVLSIYLCFVFFGTHIKMERQSLLSSFF